MQLKTRMLNITQSNSGPCVTALVLRKYSIYSSTLALSVGNGTVTKDVLLQTLISEIPYVQLRIPYLTWFNFTDGKSLLLHIKSDSRGKVDIFWCDSTGHCQKKKFTWACV